MVLNRPESSQRCSKILDGAGMGNRKIVPFIRTVFYFLIVCICTLFICTVIAGWVYFITKKKESIQARRKRIRTSIGTFDCLKMFVFLGKSIGNSVIDCQTVVLEELLIMFQCFLNLL